MKKRISLFCLICLFCLPRAASADGLPRIGLFIYNGTDTFMTTVCERILQNAGGAAQITLKDGGNSQVTQNMQVQAVLERGVDALIVNPVDRMAAVYLIRAAAARGVPVVFINREPLYEDLSGYADAYYVGNDPKESGAMCGELIAEHFKAHPEADRNGDGLIQYVMLKGEPGHQDAELRTIHSIAAIRDAGFAVENLAEVSAMWERVIAQEKMAHIIASYGDRIECVIANNDEMALGAIEALKAAGFFADGRALPVVGVDATSYALAALKEGTLLGTVLNDGAQLADAALELALLLAKGGSVKTGGFSYPVDRGVYVWVPSRKVVMEKSQ